MICGRCSTRGGRTRSTVEVKLFEGLEFGLGEVARVRGFEGDGRGDAGRQELYHTHHALVRDVEVNFVATGVR